MNEQATMLRLRPVVLGKVKAYLAKYPTADADESESKAFEAALRAAKRFDGRGTLEGWVASKVWYALTETGKFRVLESANLDALPCRSTFDLERLLFEVSADAALVIRTALQVGTKYGTVSKLRRLGWLQCSIDAIFNEIREAL